jgi:NAD(P)-dependent dehydrogenase (short-subunit alcohol dehydrogenase family)
MISNNQNTPHRPTSDTSISIGRRRALAGLGVSGLVLMASEAATQPASAQTARELAGKAALVTGARNNLGRGFAVALAEMGANVLVHHHTPDTRDQADETARQCRAHGVKTALFAGDLSRPATVRAMFDAALKSFGRIDVVVNNAGRIKKAPLAEVTEEEFELCMGINTRGTFFCMQEAARRISDGGRIINIGTSLLNASTPNYSAYAGTKAPMEEFARMLAREIGHRGVTVNVVAPGAVDTPFFHSQETPQSVAYLSAATPSKRLGRIADIVPMVAFLASARSQWVTGQTIWVNDGYSTR